MRRKIGYYYTLHKGEKWGCLLAGSIVNCNSCKQTTLFETSNGTFGAAKLASYP